MLIHLLFPTCRQYGPSGNYPLLPASQPDDATQIQVVKLNRDDASNAYVKLVNLQLYAVDVSGWRLQKGGIFTFAPGTVVPHGGTLLVAQNVAALRDQHPSGLVLGPLRLPTQPTTSTVELVDGKGNVVSQA